MSGRRVATWPVGVLALPAAVAIWSGWVGLGAMTGFGVVTLLPGIWDGARINTAITLPIGAETYAAYALRAWLTPGTPVRARQFAKGSAIGALILGALGQIGYHLMAAAHVTAAPWPITAVVACLPVGVLGMGAALAHLLTADDVEPVPTGNVSRTAGPAPVVSPPFRPAMSAPPVQPAAPAGPVAPVRPGFAPAGRPPDRSGGSTRSGLGERSTTATRDGSGARQAAAPRTDAQLSADLHRLAERNGGIPPSQYAVKQALGIGSSRATRLLAELAASEQPAAPPVTNGATEEHDNNQGAKNA